NLAKELLENEQVRNRAESLGQVGVGDVEARPGAGEIDLNHLALQGGEQVVGGACGSEVRAVGGGLGLGNVEPGRAADGRDQPRGKPKSSVTWRHGGVALILLRAPPPEASSD